MPRTPSGISPALAVDRRSATPLYRQVYDAYRTAIVEGRLRAGERVPSTRALAVELSISRIPILDAYAQLLAEGYFESHVGACTVVSRSLPDQVIAPQARASKPTGISHGPRPLSVRSSKVLPVEAGPWVRGWGAFGVSQVAYEHFPFPIWNSLVARHCRNFHAKSLDYGHPLGSRELREAVAIYLRTARAVRGEAEQIMIVCGSQQALEITTCVLLDPGVPVWVEEPGYGGGRDALAMAGARLVPVPVDDEGLDVGAGMRACRRARAALVTPSHQ